jgi:hypothetical protein
MRTSSVASGVLGRVFDTKFDNWMREGRRVLIDCLDIDLGWWCWSLNGMVLGDLDGIYHVCDSILALYHEDAERADQELERYIERGCDVVALICKRAGLWK